MGRIRQSLVKRIAKEVVEKYGDMLTTDFKKNREIIDKVVKVEGKFMKNKIAGYVTHLVKIGGRNEV